MENIVIAVNVTLIVIDIRNEKRKRSVTNLNIQNDIPNNSNPVDEDDVETRRKKEENFRLRNRTRIVTCWKSGP